MGRSCVVWLLLAGCRQLLGFDAPSHAPGDGAASDMPMIDARIDAAIDAPVGCLGAGVWTVCAQQTTTLPLPTSINTDTSGMCAPMQPAGWQANGQPQACFIVAGTIQVLTSVTVSGTRPLVLVAQQGISIQATLDVASHRGSTTGPAADYVGCSSADNGAVSNNGGGGGGGGSFGARGGSGGTGNTGATLGGVAGPAIAATTLHGGCPGGLGGAGGTQSGSFGHGGGAVYLVSGGTITISGSINASGAAAEAAPKPRAGGGGGGSGGMIVLYASSISLSGMIFANGGGGSGGADSTNAGASGSDSSQATIPGIGGSGAGVGGPGGEGGYLTFDAMGGAMGGSDGGGGRGGGSVGVIRVISGQALNSGQVSPPPS